MIYVGIDVAKEKHDCCILGSEGETILKSCTIPNNLEGFNFLYEKILAAENDLGKVKVGLEATGHYSFNILGFLLDRGLRVFVINPLHTNLYRKSISLRKTKTDKIDSHLIAKILMSDADLKQYSYVSYQNEELKSLTRYRFAKVRDRARQKQAVSRLVNILFPEFENIFSTIHGATAYAILNEFPGAFHIAKAHLATLSKLIKAASNGRYKKANAETIRDLSRKSVGSYMPAKSLELKHTIKTIRQLDDEIDEIESAIQAIMNKIQSPLLSIPGLGVRMTAMIIAEIGDFNNFESPDKILAYAGVSPSTHQSGNYAGAHARMEKRGSRYLRYALYNAALRVCQYDPVFSAYLQKKISEGKHYYVAVSHVIKKLIRVIYHLETRQEPYAKAA
jgi:transposase